MAPSTSLPIRSLTPSFSPPAYLFSLQKSFNHKASPFVRSILRCLVKCYATVSVRGESPPSPEIPTGRYGGKAIESNPIHLTDFSLRVLSDQLAPHSAYSSFSRFSPPVWTTTWYASTELLSRLRRPHQESKRDPLNRGRPYPTLPYPMPNQEVDERRYLRCGANTYPPT